jgi:hypothetical protein
LIQLSEFKTGEPSIVRLVETANDELPPDRRYVTLSYCWGASPTFEKLQTNTIEALKAGWSISSLSKTFQDAFVVTAKLGLQFIWIDAMCIIQDSEEDWKVESATMAKVYSYSFVNIAAAASSDANGGLFRERRAFATNPVKVRIDWADYVAGDFYCVADDPWDRDVVDSTLLSRGWVFQERLLSGRTVYFSRNQLLWECGELYASEVFPSGGPWDLEFRRPDSATPERLPDGIDLAVDGRFKHHYVRLRSRAAIAATASGSQGDPMQDRDFLYVWSSVVRHYSHGNLTFAKDRLVAISGVASQLSNSITSQDYVLGLWRDKLPLLLLWYVDGDEPPTAVQPQVYLGPTWSWASQQRPVEYWFPFLSETEPVVRIEILETTAASGINTFVPGPRTRDALTVRGSLCEARIVKSIHRNLDGPLSSSFLDREDAMGKYEGTEYSWKPFAISENELLFPSHGLQTTSDFCNVSFDGDPATHVGSRIFCLRVATGKVNRAWGHRGTDCGLILARTGGVNGEYVRIGYFDIAPKHLVRSWRSGGATRFQRRKTLAKSLFKGGTIGREFYEEYDGEDMYAITII